MGKSKESTGAKTHIEGLIVFDRNNKVLGAFGLAADPAMRAVLTSPDWRAEARARRLSALSLNGAAYGVLVAPMHEGELVALSAAPADAVFEFLGAVDFAYDILNHIITDPFDGMTVIDREARVAYLSPVHERFFGLSRGEANGRPVKDVIENTTLDRVVRNGKAEIGHIQKMRGLERIVSRVPVFRDGEVVGAIGRVMFKGPEQVDALARRVHDLESEVSFYRREAAELRRRTYALDDIIGESAPIRRLREQIARVAPLDVPVLVCGESGTGKELVAHALHRFSKRSDKALVTVNAAALPSSLVEAELFGYEPGSFTGADRKGRRGKFEQADGGTIFLDEIGDMPLDVQVKLLRVLQDRMVERVGGEQAREVDFRLVCATNGDLARFVAEDRFRMDLYYRISTVILEVPSLAERRADIPLLVRHFLAEFARRHGRPQPELDDDVLDHLCALDWPGNVRQLRHEVERAFIFADSHRLRVENFGRRQRITGEWPASPVGSSEARVASDPDASLQDKVHRFEVDLIQSTLQRYAGNKKRAAEVLGISRSYLYKKLGQLDSDAAE